MKVHVTYPSDGSNGKPRIRFDVDVPNPVEPSTPVNHEFLLEYVWRAANYVHEGDKANFRNYAAQAGVDGVRSMMVGDMAAFDDGTIWICNNTGWKQISREEAEIWITLDSRDRVMGVEWAVNKGWITGKV
jgi:hypothetical protein